MDLQIHANLPLWKKGKGFQASGIVMCLREGTNMRSSSVENSLSVGTFFVPVSYGILGNRFNASHDFCRKVLWAS